MDDPKVLNALIHQYSGRERKVCGFVMLEAKVILSLCKLVESGKGLEDRTRDEAQELRVLVLTEQLEDLMRTYGPLPKEERPSQ